MQLSTTFSLKVDKNYIEHCHASNIEASYAYKCLAIWLSKCSSVLKIHNFEDMSKFPIW